MFPDYSSILISNHPSLSFSFGDFSKVVFLKMWSRPWRVKRFGILSYNTGWTSALSSNAVLKAFTEKLISVRNNLQYILFPTQLPTCLQAFGPNQLQLLIQLRVSCVLIMKSYGNSKVGWGQALNYMQNSLMLRNVKQK